MGVLGVNRRWAARVASEPVEERPQGVCQNAPDLLAR